MKKIFLAGAVLLSVPFAAFAQTATTSTGTTAAPVATTTTTIADPGLVPGDLLYFMDRWGEALNTFFTFNKEKKARLRLEYAKERVAEIKEVLKKPNATLDDVKSAKDNFDAQLTDAAALVKSEKERGVDVATLARDLNDELDVSRTELKGVLREHETEASRAEAEIRAKLQALAGTDAAQIKGLTQALESITKEKDNAKQEEGDVDTKLSDEVAVFEDAMGAQLTAEKHLEQASRLRSRLEELAGKVPSQAAEQLMRQAEEALKRGDFEAAKRTSKDAEQKLEEVEQSHIDTETAGATMMGTTTEGSENIDTKNLDSLEQGIRDSEKAMEGVKAGEGDNETDSRR